MELIGLNIATPIATAHCLLPIILSSIAFVIAVLLAFGFKKDSASSKYVWKRQNNFINSMSHELRTPLTNIITNAELIKQTNPVSSEMSYPLNVIYSEASRMAKLIDDMLLLTATNIDNRSFNREEIEVDSLLISVFETFQPICKKQNIQLELLLSDVNCPMLYSDKSSITQIMTVFLDNAINHSKHSAQIQIAMSYTRKTVTIYVIDHGCGIPDEMKPFIFDPFFCGDTSHTDKSHSGLGLSVAQALAKGLNGSIGILDTDGGGATFYIKLPFDNRQ